MIRKAELKDKKSVTRLHYMAGPDVFKYFFASGEAASLAIISSLYEYPDTFLSKDFFWVEEENGNLKGAISLYPGKDKPSLENNLKNYGKEMISHVGRLSIFKIMWRSSLSKKLPDADKDELYIQAMAVFPEFRGQKVSSKLLSFAFENARENGLSRISLLTETDNSHAVTVYKKYGFTIKETVTFRKKHAKFGLHGVHKMIADV